MISDNRASIIIADSKENSEGLSKDASPNAAPWMNVLELD
jgi:hypothetical protein